MTSQDKVASMRERIRKLLALSRDASAFSNEASTAMAMASKLMAELGISEDELRNTNGTDGPLGETEVDKAYAWRVQLASAAADLFGAYVLMYGSRLGKGKIVFHGPAEVIDAAQQTYEWMVRQIETMYRAFRKDEGICTDPVARKDFRLSAAMQVRQRVRDLIKTTQVQAGDGRSLMVVERTQLMRDRIEQRLRDGGLKIGKGRSTSLGPVRNQAAAAAGHMAGRSVQIQSTVSASNPIPKSRRLT